MSPSRFLEHLTSGLDSDVNLPASPPQSSKGKMPDSNRVDVMAQIRAATMATSPLRELLKDPAVINTLHNTDGGKKKSRRQSSSSQHHEPRYSASTLMGLVVAEEEKQAYHLRSTLRSTGDRLDQEMRRAKQAESKAEFAELRARELTVRVSVAEAGKHYAELDAARANEEMRRHQMRIESLEKQVTKLQADIRVLERQRNEADESASRARDTARKFQIELSKQQAKEKVIEDGPIYGRKKWFVTGHNEGWDAGHAEGFEDGREDGFVRSGVPDHQLAEIKVVLRPGEDPDGGFWANAKEVCETLQAGPSRIDGPARVYTLRGKYRQFFMRVDADNILEAESCNLGVSNERTLEVVVEAPVPKGRLPPPPRIPIELPQMSGSGSDSDTALSPPRPEMSRQPTYSEVTRDARIDLLSQSDYRPQKRKRPSQNHPSLQNKAPRNSVQKTPSPSCTPHRARQSRHGDLSSDEDSVREISPPIPGHHAETADERDEAIANFIRLDIEGDKEWPRYMSIISHGGPKRVSDVLWSFNYVENRVKEHEDRKTPSHWDGAPNSRVERRHVWRALNLTSEWGEECRTILALVGHYGKYGRRYQDPQVISEIDNTAAPTEKTWKRFVKLLHSVDAQYLSSRLMENM